MEHALSPFGIILVGVPVGLLAAWVMHQLMLLVSLQRDVPVDMVKALGSLMTGNDANAEKVGRLIHLMSGALFAIVYLALWHEWQLTQLHQTVYLGLGFGFVHGLLSSYALMMFVAERHPLEDYRNATLSVGFIHLLGHLVFGLLVGALGGVAIRLFG